MGFGANSSQDFQASQRGRIDLQKFFTIDFFQVPDMSESGLLCFIQVFDNSTGAGNEAILIVADAKTFEGGGAEML